MPVYTPLLNLLKKVVGIDPPTDKFNIQTMMNDNWDKIDSALALQGINGDVRAATTANITLSGTQTIDGVALAAGDRVLVKNQTTGSQNGIYVVATGAWARAADADNTAKLAAGLNVFVRAGTANGGKRYSLSNTATVTLGTTAMTFGLTSATLDSAATAGTAVLRDTNGRAQVAAPSVAADIARKDTVDAAISTAASDASSKASAAQSAAISAAATDATNKANAVQTNLDAQTGPANPTAVTLSPGLQSITASRRSRLRNLKISGRTLVNLLGRDGGCESLAMFTPQGTSPTLSTTQVKQGVNSIKCVSAAGAQSYLYKDFTYPLDTTKQYLIAAWVYIESFSAGLVGLRLYDVGGTVNNRYSKYATTTTVGSWQLVYLKIPTANTLVGNGFRLAFGAFSSGGADAVCYIDSMALYEVSSADYTAIDSMTSAQVAAKWPYVDDAKHVNAVYVNNAGKNLLPPFTEWPPSSVAIATGPYSLTHVATAAFQNNEIYVEVVPGQTYTFSMTQTGAGVTTSVRATDSNKVEISGTRVDLTATGAVTATVNAPANAKYIRVALTTSVSSGTFTFTNPQLELGSTATTFEPKRGSYLYLPDAQLRSNVDGSVADSLYTDGEGKPRKTKRIDGLTLDGGLSWSIASSYTGYKQLGTALTNAVNTYGLASRREYVVDYKGSIYGHYDASAGTIGAGYSTISAGSLYLLVANSDTGWGDSYTPSAAEIAVYFNGWRMYRMEDASGNTPYNGTGTKGWFIPGVGSGTPTLPTTVVTGYTPYRLIYQLAASVDEALNFEGDLVLHEGGNQIEVGTGIVVREAANPMLWAASGEYLINNTALTPTQLKYRTRSIITVSKNGVKENRWTNPAGSTYGQAQAVIQGIYFDSSATYAVTYLVLDTYGLGIAPSSISAEYASNQKEALDDVNRGVSDLRTAVSVLQSQKAGKQQAQWIAPTLLNGWVNLGGLTSPAGYLKDEFGIVRIRGIIKSGVLTNSTFKLPRGYCPAYDTIIPSSSNNGTTTSNTRIVIRSTGDVMVYDGVNNEVYLDNIAFLAAQ